MRYAHQGREKRGEACGWGECKPALEIQSMMTDVTDQWNIFSIFLI